MGHGITRRQIIHAGIAGAIAGTVRGDTSPAQQGKAFRVAHLTDMHVVPGPTRSGEGFAMALRITRMDGKRHLKLGSDDPRFGIRRFFTRDHVPGDP